jgi:hypothetical protein
VVVLTQGQQVDQSEPRHSRQDSTLLHWDWSGVTRRKTPLDIDRESVPRSRRS